MLTIGSVETLSKNNIIDSIRALPSSFSYIELGEDHYMVRQGEVGFSNSEKIGTSGVKDCIALIVRNEETSKVALAHIDYCTGTEYITNIFHYLEHGDKEVVLIGANGKYSETNIQKILRVVLDLIVEGHNVSMKKLCILTEEPVISIVVDPKTLNISKVVNTSISLPLSRTYLYSTSEKEREKSQKDNDPISVAFDLTKYKDYLPQEVYKSTVCKSYFESYKPNPALFKKNEIKELLNKKNVDFACIPSTLKVEGNSLAVNKKLESYRETLDNIQRHLHLRSQMKTAIDSAQAYKKAIDGLMEEIKNSIPDTISNREEIINSIFSKLITKKIFIGENSKVFNNILSEKITKKLSDLFNDSKNSLSEEGRLKQFYSYLDSKECKISLECGVSFSTKLTKSKKLEKILAFAQDHAKKEKRETESVSLSLE